MPEPACGVIGYGWELSVMVEEIADQSVLFIGRRDNGSGYFSVFGRVLDGLGAHPWPCPGEDSPSGRD